MYGGVAVHRTSTRTMEYETFLCQGIERLRWAANFYSIAIFFFLKLFFSVLFAVLCVLSNYILHGTVCNNTHTIWFIQKHCGRSGPPFTYKNCLWRNTFFMRYFGFLFFCLIYCLLDHRIIGVLKMNTLGTELRVWRALRIIVDYAIEARLLTGIGMNTLRESGRLACTNSNHHCFHKKATNSNFYFLFFFFLSFLVSIYANRHWVVDTATGRKKLNSFS